MYKTELKCKECGNKEFVVGIKTRDYPTLAAYVDMYQIECGKCGRLTPLDCDSTIRFDRAPNVEVA